MGDVRGGAGIRPRSGLVVGIVALSGGHVGSVVNTSR